MKRRSFGAYNFNTISGLKNRSNWAETLEYHRRLPVDAAHLKTEGHGRESHLYYDGKAANIFRETSFHPLTFLSNQSYRNILDNIDARAFHLQDTLGASRRCT